jgi:HSP20 family protein
MSLFSTIPQSDFQSLFRLLDDYDDHRNLRTAGRTGASLRTFQPRFDVHEEQDAYHLNGELPGIDQKDIQIDFTDAQTLTIRGRVERNYSHHEGDNHEGAKQNNHNPTVEDEPEGGDKGKEVSKSESNKKEVGKHHKQHVKYWATERSVGEFFRSFSFPTNVDQDKVKASLKNGILNVVVPKAHAPTARRIQIES